MGARRVAVGPCLALVVLGSPGCHAFAPSHVVRISKGLDHPWHQVPALIGLAIAIVPATIVSLPVMFVEETLGIPSVFSAGADDPPSRYTVMVPCVAFAYVVALPFVIGGLPWEFGDGSAPATPAPAEEPPAPAATGCGHAPAR